MQRVPRYRIQAVAHATHLTDATLRAWERRYGLPVPARAPNGYRLYCDDDISLVRTMQRLIAQGHAPADAARLARQVADQAPMHRADIAPAVVQQIIRAGLAYDAGAMEAALDHARAVGSAWRVFTEVAMPCMQAVGDAWEDERLTVGHEHFISEAVSGMLRGMLRLMAPPLAARTLLLACVAEEQHAVPLLGVGIFAAHAGWQPVLLGQRTPSNALADAVATLQPDAVAISATMPFEAAQLSPYLACVPTGRWIAGGPGLAPHRVAIEAAGGRLGEAVASVTQFLGDLGARP